MCLLFTEWGQVLQPPNRSFVPGNIVAISVEFANIANLPLCIANPGALIGLYEVATRS